MKTITLTAITAAILISGCGGGSSGGSTPAPIDPMTQKDYIVIYKHYPAEVCTSTILHNNLSDMGFYGIIQRVESNHISCADYGRSNNKTSCLESDTYEYQYDTACVVGANSSTYQASTEVTISNYEGATISELLLQEASK